MKHVVIANPTNGGTWTRTGRIDFEGTKAECEAHLQEWEIADNEARTLGFTAASCDSRFMLSQKDYDESFE